MKRAIDHKVIHDLTLFSTRHSRARGNPAWVLRISLNTRFLGYDGPGGLFVLTPARIFLFVTFVYFVVNNLYPTLALAPSN